MIKILSQQKIKYFINRANEACPFYSLGEVGSRERGGGGGPKNCPH